MGQLSRQDTAMLGACLAGINHGLREITSKLQYAMDRKTLSVETWTIPTTGRIERSWNVPYRSVAIQHHGNTDPITVCSSPSQDDPPPDGPGTALLEANGAACWNLAGYDLTIYGTAGDRVTISVFTCEQPPAWR